MKLTSTVHTHSVFCDGQNTPAEMAAAAAAAGFATFGLSGHSYVAAEAFGLAPDKLARYRAEAARLRRGYAGRMEVLCGLEQDSESEPARRQDFDYLIGSVHAVRGPDGRPWVVDDTPARLAQGVADGFGGDAEALACAYCEQVADFALALRPEIVGHFDLVRKFNAGNRFFDENGPRFCAAAAAALDRVLGAGLVLEVNTGGISRGWRTDPYPSEFLLRRVLAAGGRVTVTDDAHTAAALGFGFDAALALLTRVGFAEVWQLTGAGWQAVPLR